MATGYLLPFLLLLVHNMLLHCASAAVHSHSHSVDNNLERESDGSYRARDFDHYNEESGHNLDFDHEAILGSVKEAEEYDKLTPEESKQRLSLLLPKMDLDGDGYIDRLELKQWILNSFALLITNKLSREEAEERMSEVDNNHDGVVSWEEYLEDAFGVDTEEEIGPEETGDSGMLLREEKKMFQTADINEDGTLDISEFEVFTNPEEHAPMHPHLVNQTLRERDTNRDGRIDFNEFLGEKASQEDKAWVVSQRDKFDHELDINGDGILDLGEIEKWVIPNNDEIAEEEVEHLFLSADDDQDERLSYAEVLQHHHVFVGSEADPAADYSRDHFVDEL